MTGILVAMVSDSPGDQEQWTALVAAIDGGKHSLRIATVAPFWRTGDKPWERHVLPHIEPGERVYVVLDRVTRGWLPVLTKPRLTADRQEITLLVDPSQFVPCQLEWVWGPEFGRSWRYVRFTEGCEHPFPEWREDVDLPIYRGPQAERRALEAVYR